MSNANTEFASIGLQPGTEITEDKKLCRPAFRGDGADVSVKRRPTPCDKHGGLDLSVRPCLGQNTLQGERTVLTPMPRRSAICSRESPVPRSAAIVETGRAGFLRSRSDIPNHGLVPAQVESQSE